MTFQASSALMHAYPERDNYFSLALLLVVVLLAHHSFSEAISV
jgi:hypothetical protein